MWPSCPQKNGLAAGQITKLQAWLGEKLNLPPVTTQQCHLVIEPSDTFPRMLPFHAPIDRHRNFVINHHIEVDEHVDCQHASVPSSLRVYSQVYKCCKRLYIYISIIPIEILSWRHGVRHFVKASLGKSGGGITRSSRAQ